MQSRWKKGGRDGRREGGKERQDLHHGVVVVEVSDEVVEAVGRDFALERQRQVPGYARALATQVPGVSRDRSLGLLAQGPCCSICITMCNRTTRPLKAAARAFVALLLRSLSVLWQSTRLSPSEGCDVSVGVFMCVSMCVGFHVCVYEERCADTDRIPPWMSFVLRLLVPDRGRGGHVSTTRGRARATHVSSTRGEVLVLDLGAGLCQYRTSQSSRVA